MSDMIGALGAEPVELPYGQVLTGLATRLIDGAENNWPSYVTANHYKAARYYTLTEHTMSPEVLVMSRKAWQGLTDEERDIVRAAARESNKFMRQQWNALEESSRSVVQDAGNVIVSNFDRKPFEAAMMGIYDKHVADPALRQLVDRIRQVQ
jgi:TRAP-type C4-dicarboxylate transport system substrate-binding protein